MIRIEAATLEEAYLKASFELQCSVTKLETEVIQYPKKGIFGIFKKNAIIVASKNTDTDEIVQEEKQLQSSLKAVVPIATETPKEKKEIFNKVGNVLRKVTSTKKVETDFREPEEKQPLKKAKFFNKFNNTVLPTSFVKAQDEEIVEEIEDNLKDVVQTIKDEINDLFKVSCFEIDEIQISIYDESTLFIEFRGNDSALLIGKEGYRYKALSYMLFNWINAKYQLQIRLEIAEFLKNQEESVSRYLASVCEMVEKDGKAQTKILDGVLIQIALKELRDAYPTKYVAIRSTRDGLKYVIINDYHTN